MKNNRGLGFVYQPAYKDHKTGKSKSSPTWWLSYSWRGQKHRESSGSTRRTEAVRLLRRRLEEMGRGRLVGPDSEKVGFEDLTKMLVDHYRANELKSLDRAEDALVHLRAFFGLYRALDITTDKANAYIVDRKAGKAKPATIQYELAMLKRMFSLAVKAERLSARPYIPSIEVRNVRTGFFETEQFEAVRRHLPQPLRPMVTFAYMTGWRIPSEVLTLQWSQVDFKAATIRLEPGTTKNSEGRAFPFSTHPALGKLLIEQRQITDAVQRAGGRIVRWVFHRDGSPIRDFRTGWANACRKAGLAGRIPHDFRRTAVRNLERAGVARSVAMKLTGHKTESVYRRYAIVSEADLAEGVAKLAAFQATDSHFGQSTVKAEGE